MSYPDNTFLPQMLSPSAYEIGRYGRTPVSYFHGLPNISIPLTEVRARGFSIPVSLSYHAGGNKPDQHPGWVGLGWSLQAGGSIVRIINGMKDEMSKEEYKTNHDSGYLYRIAEVQNEIDWNSNTELSLNSRHWFDNEPDEYIISAPGIHASFYITGENSIAVVSRDESAIELEGYEIASDSDSTGIEMYPGKSPKPLRARRYSYLKSFIIRDKYGNRYFFGGNDSAIEYSVVQYPNLYNDWSPQRPYNWKNPGNWKAIATANSWKLTRIERTDGEVVEFEYEKNGVPIVMSDVHHGEIFVSDDRSLEHNSSTYKDSRTGLKTNLSFHFLLPSYLTRIRCLVSGDELSFATSDSVELDYGIQEEDFTLLSCNLSGESVGPFTYAQFAAENRYRKLDRIHGVGRDIRFSYIESSETRLRLDSVTLLNGEQADGTYSFTYNETQLPPYNSRLTDIWGYYNATSYAGKVDSELTDLRSIRQPSFPAMQAEILTCVTYPTGGRTEYEYEAHDYSKKCFPIDFILVECAGKVTAGGLRIKAIRDYTGPDSVAQTRTFEYVKNGSSSGVLIAEGECRKAGRFEFEHDKLWYEGDFILYSEMSILPLSETDGSHVTYSSVREHFPDGSHVDYEYTNSDDQEYRDTAPEKELGRTEGCTLYPKFTSKGLYRGLLKSKTTFIGNDEVLSETMTYGIIGQNTIKSASLHSYVDNTVRFAAYRIIHCGYPALIRKEETRYLDDVTVLTEAVDYQYNSRRLPVSVRRSRSTETSEERYYYPSDRCGFVYEHMLQKGMFGVPVGKAILRNGFVISATETAYDLWDVCCREEGEVKPFPVARKTFSASLPSPVTLQEYEAAPMSFMLADPEFWAKSYDPFGNPKFVGLRNGAAHEYHRSGRTGMPGLKVVTADVPLLIGQKYQSVRLQFGNAVHLSAPFRTHETAPFTMDLHSDQDYAWYVCARLDGVDYHMATWAVDGMPDELWMDRLMNYPSPVNIDLPAGEHTLEVFHLAWMGEGGLPDESAATFGYAYREERVLEDTAAFIDLDTDEETGEGFHCEKGHEGPLEVSHPVTAGRSYILDYMLREDGQWRYVKSPYIGGAVTIGGDGMTVSNVRIYPADSMAESFMWRRFTGMSAHSDARGVTESYGYDGVGRLAEVRDNNGSLVRAHSYEFRNKSNGGAEGENRIATDEFTSADGESRRSSVNHYDGLGRLVRNVLVDGSPAGGDLVTRHEYDAMDREVKTWLPEASSPVAPAMVPGLSPETGDLPSLEADTYLYTENVYEASPLNRLLRKHGPGQAWRTADKAVRMYQMSNKTDVSDPTYHRGFGISWSGNTLTLTRDLNCTSAGMLLVEKTEDEDGRIRFDFKNVHGETVLSRSVCDDGSWNDTHFIYDAFGRMAAVLPPKLTAMLESSGRSSWAESDISDLAYLYRYDSRGNNIAKLVPGGGWTWFVYDKGDRLVLSQDVIQREQGQWTFRLEDLFGRECITGTAVLEMDSFADPLGEVNVYVTMPASPSYADTLKGYMATGLSFGSGTDILKVNYYDGYGFLGNGGFPAATDGAAAYDPSAENEYASRYALSERGLATGSLVRVLDSSGTASYLWSVAYHDDRGRPVQTCESMPSGGYRREYYAYDFTGAVTRRKSTLTPASGQAVTVVQTFTYDHMGRPVSVTHQMDDQAPRIVSLKTYDEIGRFSAEQRNGLASLIETRSYNLRSWLTGIDCPLFKETLKYQDGTTPQWGGNISEMSWGPGTAAKNYRFGYDALSRLISADYSEGSAQASANARAGGLIGGGGIIGGEIVSEGHSESYHYDRNGNMDLYGRGNLMTMIGIEGNRTTSVRSKTISYDAKGRQISSTYGKSVTTQYNILDLPQKHTVGNGTVVVDYRYAADGRKLQEKVTQGSSETYRDYAGEFIYENGTLKKILFDGGYVDMIGDSPVYMFFIKDHLGSVRAVVSETGEVQQTNEYYPYGDLFSTAGTADNSSGNRYRFTGKELGDETGLYDFSARFLQTSLGRFTTIDPLAEKYPGISPYAYCNGNPVNFVDPDGEVPVFVVTALIGAGVSGITAVIEGKSASEVLAATLGGAVDGFLCGIPVGETFVVLKTVLLNTAGGGLGDLTEQSINLAFGNQSKIEGTEIALSATFGAITGTVDVAGNNLGKHLEDFYSSDETIKSMAKEIKDKSSRRMTNKKATDQAKKIAEEAKKKEVNLVKKSAEVITYSWDIYYNLQDE